MYESYWRLDRKPFENANVTEFYYPSEAHQGALLKIRYCVENRRGAAALSGAAGLGKSLLASLLFQNLPAEFAPRVHVVFPQMPPDQLIAYICNELTGRTGGDTLDTNVVRLRDFLSENTANGKHAVLVIDEAHLLADNVALEHLRLLLNFQSQGTADLTLLFIGQPQMLAHIERTPGLEDRISVKCLLRPFNEEETASYVNHRLTVAGAGTVMFDSSAIEAIHAISRGAPRKINRLCDLALLIGYAEDRETITGSQIDAVAEEMVAVSPE